MPQTDSVMRWWRFRWFGQCRVVGDLPHALAEVADEALEVGDFGGLVEDGLVKVLDRLFLISHGGFELFEAFGVGHGWRLSSRGAARKPKRKPPRWACQATWTSMPG